MIKMIILEMIKMILIEIITMMNRDFDHYLFIINRPEPMEEKIVLIPYHHRDDHDDDRDDESDDNDDYDDESDDNDYNLKTYHFAASSMVRSG